MTAPSGPGSASRGPATAGPVGLEEIGRGGLCLVSLTDVGEPTGSIFEDAA